MTNGESQKMKPTEIAGAGKYSTDVAMRCPQCGRLPLAPTLVVKSQLQLLVGSIVAVYGPRLAWMALQWLLETVERRLTMNDG